MQFNKLEKIPKKITPCPIAEAVVELRFGTELPRELVLGIIYNAFKEEYPTFSELPISQLPTIFVNSQPDLQYAPQYRLSNKNFIFQIGPRSISLICPKEYKGWNRYINEIDSIFEKLSVLKVVKIPERLALRYINFFENLNIFEKVDGVFSLGENKLTKNSNIFRTEFKIENFHCTYQISNNSSLENKISGSSIDIDLSVTQGLEPGLYKKIIENAHEIEKRIFFSALNNEFLSTLQPEY